MLACTSGQKDGPVEENQRQLSNVRATCDDLLGQFYGNGPGEERPMKRMLLHEKEQAILMARLHEVPPLTRVQPKGWKGILPCLRSIPEQAKTALIFSLINIATSTTQFYVLDPSDEKEVERACSELKSIGDESKVNRHKLRALRKKCRGDQYSARIPLLASSIFWNFMGDEQICRQAPTDLSSIGIKKYWDITYASGEWWLNVMKINFYSGVTSVLLDQATASIYYGDKIDLYFAATDMLSDVATMFIADMAHIVFANMAYVYPRKVLANRLDKFLMKKWAGGKLFVFSPDRKKLRVVMSPKAKLGKVATNTSILALNFGVRTASWVTFTLAFNFFTDIQRDLVERFTADGQNKFDDYGEFLRDYAKTEKGQRELELQREKFLKFREELLQREFEHAEDNSVSEIELEIGE